MFVNYAHRGACYYFPENTMSSFFAALSMGANGIETDIQRTRDDRLVLFHDDTVDRVTNGTGNLSDFSYKELYELFVFGGKNRELRDKIVLLEDFLKYIAFKDLMFAIEFKQPFVEKDTICLLEKYGVREKTVLTSFNFDNLERAKEINEKYKIGYLVKKVNNDVIACLRELKGEELCPHSGQISRENVELWHRMGFHVRAWGISNSEVMQSVYDAGVDGMTVNFPDLLTAYIGQKLKR